MEKDYILVHNFLASEGMTEVRKKFLYFKKMCLKKEPRYKILQCLSLYAENIEGKHM